MFLLLCCFYKVFTALKKPILFLRCFYYIAAPAKFLLLLLFPKCWRNNKSDVENLWLWLYIMYIRCKSDVVIHLIGIIICIIKMWKFIWLEYYKCKSEVEIHFIRITKDMWHHQIWGQFAGYAASSVLMPASVYILMLCLL